MPALIMRFVQPHHQTIPILGRFYRLYDDVHAVCLEKRGTGAARCRSRWESGNFLLAGHAYDRNIEFVAMPDRLRLPPISCMGQEAIGEAVQALIGMRIWVDTGFQERQTNHVIVNVMPILPIVQQADTVSSLAYINPAMSTGLKTSQIPDCVTMGGPLNAAKLDFIGGSCAVDGQGKRCFQQGLVFVPVNLGGDVDAW